MSATAASSTSATVSWSAVSNATGYRVYKTVNGTTTLAATAVMFVASLVLPLADPPPDTDTEFDSGVPAFDATFTVTVIGG